MYAFPYRSATKLLAVTVATNTTQTGTAFRLAPQDPATGAPVVKVSTVVSATGGASTPTAQVVLETSADGTTWLTAATGAARAADGQTYAEVLDPANGFVELYVRARLVLAGGTPPSATCQVEVVADRAFVLLAA